MCRQLTTRVLLLAAPGGAQDGTGTLTKWYLLTVKTGHDVQWEQAFKEHLDWHRHHNDTWTWNTYMIVSGERLGQYITMSSDHAWADSVEWLTSELWQYRPDLTYVP